MEQTKQYGDQQRFPPSQVKRYLQRYVWRKANLPRFIDVDEAFPTTASTTNAEISFSTFNLLATKT